VGTGKALSYDLTVGTMLDIEDMIHMLSPFDTPLTGGITADGRAVLPKGIANQVKTEWIHETLLDVKTALTEQADAAETSLTVTTGTGIGFSTGDVLICESEYMRVTGVSTDTLTVTRGFGGSTDVTHVTGKSMLNLGQVLQEGSDPENARWQDRTSDYNYTQIFGPTAIQISGTENVLRKYGLGGETEFQHQVANRTKEHWLQLEQAVLYGVRVYDTTNKWRQMGGLAQYLTEANSTVVDSTTTTFSESSLLAVLQSIFDNGGAPKAAIMSSKNKRLASAFTSSGTIQVQRTDNERGTVVDYFDSDFGRISLILDRWCRVQDVFVYDPAQIQLATLRPLVFEMLAKTGDSMKGQIVAEKTLKVRRYRHAGRFTALT
jgi:hypothetical protein